MSPKQDAADVITPGTMLVWGGGSLTAGMLIAGAASYYSARKSMLKEGIDLSAQARVLPMAFKALAASTFLTGCIGVGGFYVLKSHGFFKTDSAPLPAAEETLRMLRDPRGFWRELAEESSVQQKSK